jgi:hypothetical protein
MMLSLLAAESDVIGLFLMDRDVVLVSVGVVLMLVVLLSFVKTPLGVSVIVGATGLGGVRVLFAAGGLDSKVLSAAVELGVGVLLDAVGLGNRVLIEAAGSGVKVLVDVGDNTVGEEPEVVEVFVDGVVLLVGSAGVS